ncbi:aldehyde dehydrogenase family protein [Streptomyces sp. B1866]|uniref:aldehyde dehydrogenase family protein n=1 Tax=Streptomyces sp. B1866 TaxID=3075431 RepID=UPI00288DA9D0|nr:aldehyde dehydrogenase family protein [Streptomyces sp. B1866]MDT3396874.1 aldehyde dehydrogenase family protein [Streptomyces sp. B1866]
MTAAVTDQLTRRLGHLRGHAREWAGMPLAQKRDLLLRVRERVAPNAERWVELSCRGKGIAPDSALAGEEWLTGPFALLTYLDALAGTVGRLADGGSPLDRVRVRTRPDGRLSLRVLPYEPVDRLFQSGFGAEVWLRPGVTESQARERLGRGLRDGVVHDGVCLVLGAGNINATAPLDVLYKMVAGNAVVLCKLNPVNDYLQPVLEDIFAPLADRGFLHIVSGGAEVGAFLTGHDDVTSIHITGSNAAHDAIVFGPGEEGARRRAARTPLLAKPITSELGGVGATVVVPGPWTRADLRFQAAHAASQKLHNSGFNCTASQIVVLPGAWRHADAFTDELRAALRTAPERPAYYPGAAERVRAALAAHPGAERLGGEVPRVLATGLNPDDAGEYLFSTECFAPVQGVTRLPGATARDYLDAAVAFCNERLAGTLGVNLIIHPATIAELGPAFDAALVDLRYGTVAVNAWTSVGYLTPRANWGAFPGHELHDAGSGIGTSHNALLLDDVERTVVRGPFRPAPRSLLRGEWSLSPKPAWFVNNRTAQHTSRLAARYTARPNPARLPAVVLSALRG